MVEAPWDCLQRQLPHAQLKRRGRWQYSTSCSKGGAAISGERGDRLRAAVEIVCSKGVAAVRHDITHAALLPNARLRSGVCPIRGRPPLPRDWHPSAPGSAISRDHAARDRVAVAERANDAPGAAKTRTRTSVHISTSEKLGFDPAADRCASIETGLAKPSSRPPSPLITRVKDNSKARLPPRAMG
jgi:hypothetical protein